jgi:hypothetical protein
MIKKDEKKDSFFIFFNFLVVNCLEKLILIIWFTCNTIKVI